jgi:hypothetical protein
VQLERNSSINCFLRDSGNREYIYLGVDPLVFVGMQNRTWFQHLDEKTILYFYFIFLIRKIIYALGRGKRAKRIK